MTTPVRDSSSAGKITRDAEKLARSIASNESHSQQRLDSLSTMVRRGADELTRAVFKSVSTKRG